MNQDEKLTPQVSNLGRMLDYQAGAVVSRTHLGLLSGSRCCL
jgi:hypothetical protein